MSQIDSQNSPSENLALRGDETIAIPQISFGNPDTTWQKYGLLTAPINYGSRKTGFNGLLKDGKLVTIVGSFYRVLPNEEAAKIADQAAKMAGLVPFHEFKGKWIHRMDKHIITDKEGNRMHALYAINEPYKVNGEDMHIGVGIHNSIDGTTAFGAGIFTFRQACSNMVLAGTKGWQMRFDQRETIDYIYKRHTAGLDPIVGQLSTVILAVMDRAKMVIETYRDMAQHAVEKDLIERLKNSKLSKKVLPDYIAKPEEATVNPLELSQWNLYNDITAAIWHNAKSGLRTKEHQFDLLHKALEIQVRA
jgi:hypothetical protein